MYTIPNSRDAGIVNKAPQSQIFKTDWDVLANGIYNTGVLSGCAVSQPSLAGMSVDVTSGTVVSTNTSFTVTGANKLIAAADASFPRLDLVAVNSAGALTVRTGTAATSPLPPDLTAGDVALAFVYVPALASGILNANIVDKRVFLTKHGANQHVTGPGSAVVDNGTGNVYPVTIAGIQAAHDDALFNGGPIILPPYSVITSLGTTLSLTKPKTKLMGNFSTIKAPANNSPYLLVTLGAFPSGVGVTSLLTADAKHGDNQVSVVSTAGFADDDWVDVTLPGSVPQLHRVSKVVDSTTLRLYRPVSSRKNVLNSSSQPTGAYVGKYSPFIRAIELHDIFIDNNGNTNPGILPGFTSLASTTFSSNVATLALSGTLTNATGFNIGDFVLIRDSNKTGYGEAKGWVTLITNKVGSVISFNGGVPFSLSSSTATIDKFSVNQLAANGGVAVLGTYETKVVNLTGTNILGSLLFGEINYESHYDDTVAYKCGFGYFATVAALPFLAGIQCLYEEGSYMNCRSNAGLSWGIQTDQCYQLRGTLQAVECHSRGVKIVEGTDCRMSISALHNYATGFAIGGGTSYSVFDVHAEGNAGNGLWFVNDESNTDNYVRFSGSGNNSSGADYGDVAGPGATDVRSIVEILTSENVVAPLSRGIIRQAWQPIPYDASYLTATSGTFTVPDASSFTVAIKQNGKTITVAFSIVGASVSATSTNLYLGLPGGYQITRNASAPVTAINNNTELNAPMVAALAGFTYLHFFTSGLQAIGSGSPWSVASGSTYLFGQITFEVN